MIKSTHKKINKLKRIFSIIILLFIACFNLSCHKSQVSINIISTSDIHGKLFPYDYLLDKEDKSGSLAQIGTAIKNLRNENTILIDLGDLIQGNSAEFFLDDDVNPMVQAENLLKYDVFVIGNHEFDFGMDNIRKLINTYDGDVLCANVFYEDGKSIAKPYVIKEKQGVKIGIIGVVTSDIKDTNNDILKKENIIVKDSVEAIKNIVDEIKNDVDIIVAACHIGLNTDYEESEINVANIAKNIKEVDVILSAHSHYNIEGKYINDVLITENADGGKTLSNIDIDFEKNKNEYKIINMKSKNYDIKDYKEDTLISENEKLVEADKRIREEQNKVLAYLKNKNLTDDNDINGIPIARIRDTALTRLINDTLMHYSDAEISMTGLFNDKANLYEGVIRKKDMRLLYNYDNALYKLEMTGRQIKKFMESSSAYFNKCEASDNNSIENITANKNYDKNIYYIFGGLKYDIDITKDVGERIKNITLLNGEALDMDKKYMVATNNFISNFKLLKQGALYDKNDGLPILIEGDIRSDIGGIRELISDYIVNVKGKKTEEGIVELELEDVDEYNANWKVVYN